MTLAQLLAEHRHVLLDFDGPVCAVFGGVSAHETAAQFIATLCGRGVQLPAEVSDTADPFDVLRTAAQVSASAAPMAEAVLRDLELHAVTCAPLTPGIRGALHALTTAGHTITIVSNNSEAAVRAVIATYQLTPQIGAVVARTEPDPQLLKPNPHLVRRAINLLEAEPADCVLIGDSITDITAARHAGTAVIAYANKAHKRYSFAPHEPDALIDDINDITTILPSTFSPIAGGQLGN